MSFETEVAGVQNKVMNYVHDIRTGNIPAGKTMKQAMDRFVNDLKKANKPDSEYYMDWVEVFKFDRWAKMFKHSKGVLAGTPFILHESLLWESANIFGFKRRRDGGRRYREAYIFKSRKNSKTALEALMASYVAFLSDQQEEVYVTGWSKSQSDICYNEMMGQIEGVEMLRGKYKEAYKFLTVHNNKSIVKALSREAKKSFDGFNPSFAIVDEYNTAHETNEIVDLMKSGMMARKEPLTVYISTAGFHLNYPGYEFYQYCKDILNPEKDVENDTVFIALYELDEGDDIKDESNWIKANPIVATYEAGLESLRAELKLALDQPSKMRNFLTKNMNMWVDAPDEAFLDLKKWNRQSVENDFIEDFLKGANLYYGIDLSSTTDLTSLGWVAVKNGKFLVGQKSYMPSEKYTERMSRDKIRFDIFRDNEELELTEGAVVDYAYLKHDLIQMARKYGVKEVGFDVWNATYMATELQREGFTMVEIGQGITKLSEPTKKFKEALYAGDLYHAEDGLLKWAIGNAVSITDPNDNMKISKKHSKDRIDPVAAILNAFARAMYDDQIHDLNAMIMSDSWTF